MGDEDFVQRVQSEAREWLATAELAPYRAYEDEILPGVVQDIESIAAATEVEARMLADAHASMDFAAERRTEWERRARRFGRTLRASFYVMALLLLIDVLYPRSPLALNVMPPGTESWAGIVGPLGALVLAAGVPVAVRRSYGQSLAATLHASAQGDLYSAESVYQSSLRAAVGASVRSFINTGMQVGSELRFPATAPALVELDVSRVVDTATVTRVSRFIEQHTSSAVGLAGPRGVGKSTILRSLATSEKGKALGVYVPSPVRYENHEFVRRLFEDVAVAAQDLLGGHRPEVTRGLSVGRHRRIRAVSAASAFVLGVFILTSGYVHLTVSEVVGISLMGVALLLVLVEYARLLDRARLRGRVPTDLAGRLVADALHLLRWRPELNTTRQTGFKPFGGAVEVAEEDSVAEAAVDRSHAELVSELRRFLRDLRRAAELDRIVVTIDELDKLARPEDLVDAVNGLKDLFHIEGVHFVVSVSTEALDSFVLRGVPARDAFDSSFDQVFAVQRLDPLTAMEVLRSRSVGFPPPMILFCHAWAGGLPRDLLRAARHCLEASRSGAIGQSEVVRDVVRSSSLVVLASFARSVRLGDEARSRRAPLAAVGEIVRTGSLAEAAEALRAEAELMAMPGGHDLVELFHVAHEIEAEFTHVIPPPRWDEIERDEGLLARTQALALRMAAIGDPEAELSEIATPRWSSEEPSVVG